MALYPGESRVLWPTKKLWKNNYLWKNRGIN